MDDEGSEQALGASYRLVDQLGRGATGTVWRAIDRRSGETVAAKLLHAEHLTDHDLVSRFLRERTILTGLRHPNLVAVRDLVAEGDQLAIVMDYVDGGSLRDTLRSDGPLAPELALGVVAAVLDGLAAAHAQHVLHRDIKPDNVLVAQGWRDLAPGAVNLTDFGIARIVADRAGATTGLLGTPEYMCPELLVTGAADLPADIYGVGILLYELLAGRTPFAGPGTDYTIAHRHVSSEPPPLPLPEPLWSMVASLLDKDPSARPTAGQAAAQLRALRTDVAGLEPLPTQAPPEHFASAAGPATVVRGLERDTGDTGADAPTAAPLGDLGSPGSETVVRPMQRVAAPEPRARRAATAARRRTPWWREPRGIALLVVGVLLLAGAAFWVSKSGGGGPSQPGGNGDPVTATQQSTPTPTGLTISRRAVWDPKTQQVQLTVTYQAQQAPLSGPFLEVVPGASKGADCPAPQWQDDAAKPNLASLTGISVRCGWTVDPIKVPAQGSTQVTATLSLPLGGGDPNAALQSWLESEGSATEEATSDPQVTSTSYPVQRLTGIRVDTPPRTTGGSTLRITLVPEWPSGADQLHPLYRSPSVDAPSSMLDAIAGGESGVRFSDACSGALSVSPNGLVVTALTLSPACHVNARVGNFTDLASDDFAITTRGG